MSLSKLIKNIDYPDGSLAYIIAQTNPTEKCKLLVP